MQPAVLQCLGRGFGAAFVAHEHIGPFDEDFAVLGNAYLHAGQGLACGPDTDEAWQADGGGATVFRLAIDLTNDQIEAGEELQVLHGDRCSAREQDARLVKTQRLLHLFVHQLARQALFHVPPGTGLLSLQSLGMPVAPGTQRPACQGRLGAGGGVQLAGNGRLHLLPDTGYAKEDGGMHLLQMLAQGFKRAGEIDLVARQHMVADGAHLLGHMGQRQVGNQTVLRCHRESGREPGGGPAQVGVAQLHGLGVARGARGVDQRTDIAFLDGVQAPLHFGVVLHTGTERHERLPGHWRADACGSLRRGFGRGAAHHHRGAQAGQCLGFARRFLPLLRVFHQQYRAATVFDDVGDFVGCTAPVDTGGHAAHHHGGQVHGGPFRPVEAQDTHGVARLHTQRHQGARGLAHLGGVVTPVRGLPASGIAHVIGR